MARHRPRRAGKNDKIPYYIVGALVLVLIFFAFPKTGLFTQTTQVGSGSIEIVSIPDKEIFEAGDAVDIFVKFEDLEDINGISFDFEDKACSDSIYTNEADCTTNSESWNRIIFNINTIAIDSQCIILEKVRNYDNLNWLLLDDTDKDGIPDIADADADGDGSTDPFKRDSNGNGIHDDAEEGEDNNEDGINDYWYGESTDGDVIDGGNGEITNPGSKVTGALGLGGSEEYEEKADEAEGGDDADESGAEADSGADSGVDSGVGAGSSIGGVQSATALMNYGNSVISNRDCENSHGSLPTNTYYSNSGFELGTGLQNQISTLTNSVVIKPKGISNSNSNLKHLDVKIGVTITSNILHIDQVDQLTGWIWKIYNLAITKIEGDGSSSYIGTDADGDDTIDGVASTGISIQQPDTDNDGVPNGVDACQTASDILIGDSNNDGRDDAVSVVGCSDTDGDGIFDISGISTSKIFEICIDSILTPGTYTSSFASFADANLDTTSTSITYGCADYDGDGVYEDSPKTDDLCPNTPPTETADSNGCSDSQLDISADLQVREPEDFGNLFAGQLYTLDLSGTAPYMTRKDSNNDGIIDDQDSPQEHMYDIEVKLLDSSGTKFLSRSTTGTGGSFGSVTGSANKLITGTFNLPQSSTFAGNGEIEIILTDKYPGSTKSTTTTIPVRFNLGDVNNNGEVTVSDIQHLTSKLAGATSVQSYTYDIMDDNKVDALDYSQLINIYLNNPTI